MKKRIRICLLSGLTCMLLSCFAGMTAVYADWGKEIVINGAEFAGVNLTSSTGGGLMFHGDGRAESTSKDVMITYELDNLEKSSTNGILIRIDRSMATGDLSPRMLLETSDGILYRLFYNSNDLFVNKDGSVLDTSEWSHNVTFSMPKQLDGTLFVPWGSITASGTLMPESAATAPAAGATVPNGMVFTRLHFIVQSRFAAQLQSTRSTVIGSIASLRKNVDDLSASTVTPLLDSETLVFTTDEAATADVNLGDMTKGTKIYSKYTCDGTFNVSQDAETLAAFNFTRNSAEIVLDCRDGEDVSLNVSKTVKVSYNVTNGNYAYDCTAEVPEINGYTFNAESSDALSGICVKNTKIKLVYDVNPGPQLVEKYVDEDGEKIADDTLAKITSELDGYYYTCKPKHVFGYKYKAADRDLSGVITESGTITYVYESAAVKNYDVVYENDKFAGVNIKTETMGTVMIVGTNTGKGTTELSMTTFELGVVSTAEADGLLIQIDRSVAADTQQPRLLLETADGVLYKFNERNLRYDSFVLEDGTLSSLENESFHYNLERESKGTLFIPWNVLTTTGTVMPYAEVEAPAGNLKVTDTVVFTKFHFCLDSRAASMQGTNRPTGIGVIAAVSYKGEKVITEELLSPVTLNYSLDENKTDADVNLGNNRLGTKVYIKHSITGSFVVDGSVTDNEEALAAVELKRRAVQITLNFVDENGISVKSSITKQADYVDGRIVYSLTPETVVGYDFVSSDIPLEGEAYGPFTITMTYKKRVVKITVKFVDGNGNAIAEDKIIDAYYGEYTEIEADEINNYEYVSASESLHFTPVKNKEITLTYKKVGGGCGSSVEATSAVSVFVAASLLFVLIRKSKKEN